MGKIIIEGYAEREVAYDQLRLNINFKGRESTTAKATDEVMKRSENFIESLIKLGINENYIHYKEDSVAKDYRYDETNNYNAERSIYIDIGFNMVLVNMIMDLIRKHEGEINYSLDHSLSNREAIHEELLKKAFQDAKSKAEIIASSYGRAIKGIKSVNTVKKMLRENFLNCFELAEDSVLENEYVSNHIQSPTTVEKETVEVVWLI